jgi:hypothetical protein
VSLRYKAVLIAAIIGIASIPITSHKQSGELTRVLLRIQPSDMSYEEFKRLEAYGVEPMPDEVMFEDDHTCVVTRALDRTQQALVGQATALGAAQSKARGGALNEVWRTPPWVEARDREAVVTESFGGVVGRVYRLFSEPAGGFVVGEISRLRPKPCPQREFGINAPTEFSPYRPFLPIS